MKFHDPQRQRIGGSGRPCWESAYVALPGLYVEPTGSDIKADFPDTAWEAATVEVGVVIDGSWNYITVLLAQLPALLADWNEGPEEALQSWFGVEPPDGAQQRAVEPAVSVSTSKSLAELDL